MGSVTQIRAQSSDVDARITRHMEALRVLRGLRVPELYAALGMTKGTYFSRKRGLTAWTAAEVEKAATVLSVPVATLFEGLGLPSVAGAGFEPATSGTRAQGCEVVYLADRFPAFREAM